MFPSSVSLRRKIARRLSNILSLSKRKQASKIVREAQPGDSMFFIVSGKLGVYASLTDEGNGEKTEPFLLATLTSGDFFGEQALVTDEPRSATVVAKTDVIMLRFTKIDLAAAMKKYPWLESALQIEAFQNRMRTKYALLKDMIPGAKM